MKDKQDDIERHPPCPGELCYALTEMCRRYVERSLRPPTRSTEDASPSTRTELVIGMGTSGMTRRRKRLAYISGAISNGGQDDLAVQKQRMEDAIEVAQSLLDRGYAVILPHLTVIHDLTLLDRQGRTNSHEDWMENDRVIIKRCDVVFRLPGESKGADREVRWANEIGIPVFKDLETLVEVLPA